jgi:type I restriction enzyme S subunit
MKRWPTKPLGELGDLKGGGTPSRKVAEYFQGDIPWITGADVTDFYVHKAREFITPEAIENSATTLLPKNTVLVVSRTGVGKIGIAATPLCASQDLTGIICKDSVLPKYLARCLLARADSLTSAAQGATIRGITREFLSRVEIPVPPLAEQERIVRLLDEADELGKLRAQADHRTVALIPALFHEMSGDPIKNPKGWEVCSFAEVGKLDRGRSKNRPRDEPSLYGGKYPFIQTGDVANSNGEITTFTQTYSEKGLAQSRMWPAGTLVITIAANIGKTAIPACFPDSMVGFVPSDRVIVDYVRPWLVTMESRLEEAAPQMAQKNINLKILSELRIPVPPLPLQKEFAQRVTEIREVEADQVTNRTRLDALFQSMLHRAFNGEL